jgi:hypothetical protein
VSRTQSLENMSKKLLIFIAEISSIIILIVEMNFEK